jgi:very-short-patch-repair endonuclease
VNSEINLSYSPFEKGVGGLKHLLNIMEKLIVNRNLKYLARDLRNRSTLGEILLWDKVLKNKKVFGLQFNRQFPIENYIVDFICRKIKLIIEVDGYSHEFKYEEDVIRDQQLQKLGYSILRFTEKQVKYELQKVINSIENFIEQINPPAPFSKGEIG